MSDDDDPIRVVVVDDEPDVLLLLKLQLRGEGVEVVGVAEDGAEAIRLCRELRPDAVVMDLLMAGVNGFEAIATLQREFPDTGVVAYSAVAGDRVRSEMERANVPLVLKSGRATALVAALREITGRAGSDGD
jgi:two-component system OmpR family response regulator